MESNAAQAVFHVFVSDRHLFLLGRTEIKRSSVGRECRKSFKRSRTQQRSSQYPMGPGMINHHIRSLVEYLYRLLSSQMKGLIGFVHRISDVFARRMPVRIDTGRQLPVGFGIEKFQPISCVDYSGSMPASYMYARRCGLRPVESMAIDAGGRHLRILK